MRLGAVGTPDRSPSGLSGAKIPPMVPPQVPPWAPRSVRGVLCGTDCAGRTVRGASCGASGVSSSGQGSLPDSPETCVFLAVFAVLLGVDQLQRLFLDP